MQCSGGCKSMKAWLSMAAALLGFVAMIGYWVAADGLFLGMDQDQLFASATMLFLFSAVESLALSSGGCPVCPGGKKKK